MVLALAAGVAAARDLWELFQAHERLPLWDMAGHGWLGVELLRDVSAGGPVRFLADLNAQDKWPFGYSLLLLPLLTAGDASYASAAVLSLALWVAVAPLLVLAARQVDRGWRGLAAGALAGALWLICPLPRVLAVVVLREVGSSAALLAAFVFYLRARRRGSLRAWRLAAAATLGVILLKWSYGAVWVLALILDELRRRSPPERRRLLAAVGGTLSPWGPKPAAARLLAVALDGVLVAALLGINPGILVWGILAASALALLRRQRAGEAPLRRLLERLPPSARAALEIVALPLAVWWLSPWPIHPKAAFNFLLSRGGGSPRSPLDLLYYLRILVADFVLRPWLGWLLLALAVAAVGLALTVWRRPLCDARRFLLLWTATTFVLVSLHPHKEPRYLTSTVPFVFLLASLTAADLLSGPRIGFGRRRAGAVAVAALAAVPLLGGPWGPGQQVLEARWLREYPRYSGDRRLEAVLEEVARVVGRAERVGVVGVFDELSADLIRWDFYRRHGRWAPRWIELPSGFPSAAAAEVRRSWLLGWLAEEDLDRVVVLELSPESPFARRDDYQLHNAWQETATEVIRGALPSAAAPRRFPELGLTVRALRRPRRAVE